MESRLYFPEKKAILCRQKQFAFRLPFNGFDKIRACCYYTNCICLYLWLYDLLKMHFSLLWSAFLLSAFCLEKILLTANQTRQRSQLKSSVRKAYRERKMKSTLLKVIFKLCTTSKLFNFLHLAVFKFKVNNFPLTSILPFCQHGDRRLTFGKLHLIYLKSR